MKHRTCLIIRRWLDIFLYSFLSVSFIWCLLILVDLHHISSFILYFEKSFDSLLLFLTIVLLSFIINFNNHYKNTCFGLRYFYCHPPLMFSVLLGLVVFCFFGFYIGDVSFWIFAELCFKYFTTLPFFIKFPIFVLFLYFILTVLKSFRVKTKPSINQPTISIDDAKSLMSWFDNDDEVLLVDQDLFNHRQIAYRLVDELRQPLDKISTIALVGSPGSGKTSIKNMVQSEMSSDPKRSSSIEVVSLSLWQYESSISAVLGILYGLINHLSNRISVLPITGVPNKYIDSISSVGGSWAGIFNLLKIDFTPAQIVDKISSLAESINIHIVLWLEDLDRFTGRDVSFDQKNRQETEKLEPIKSLLYLLDRTSAISVVFSDTKIDSDLDIYKTSMFVERIPQLNYYQINKIIIEYREFCLNGFPRKFKDFASAAYRKSLFKLDEQTESILQLFPREYITVNRAICYLIKTPRILKASLRYCNKKWTLLCGEIDFDSLLLGSVLFVSCPKLYSFIDREIYFFKYGIPHEPETANSDKSKHRVNEEYRQILAESTDPKTRMSISAIVDHLFPAFSNSNKTTEVNERNNPQGFSSVEHSDYWQRFNSFESIDEIESDQRVYEEIENWKTNLSDSVLSNLKNEIKLKKYISFSWLFNDASVLHLLNQLFDDIDKIEHLDYELGRFDNRLDAVVDLIRRKRIDSQRLVTEAKNLIYKYQNKNIPLVFEFVKEFFSRGLLYDFLNKEQRTEIFQVYSKTFLSSYGNGDGQHFINSMKSANRFYIWWIACFLDNSKTPSNRFELFYGWGSLSNTLLSAASISVEKGMLYLLPFLISVKDVIYHDYAEREGLKPKIRKEKFFNYENAERYFYFKRLSEICLNSKKVSLENKEIEEELSILIAGAKSHITHFEIIPK